MPNTREKLIELLCDVQYLGGLEEKIADHLIANGVTIPVRCKDCRKCHTYKDVITGQLEYKCYLWNGSRNVDADMFCDAGERWMPLPQPPMGNKPDHKLDECSPQTEEGE